MRHLHLRSLPRGLLLGALLLAPSCGLLADEAAPAAPKLETAIVGGGCFWCTEAVFQRVPGVVGVRSGYAGGRTVNPTYEEICTGDTGHAEVIEISYDPAKVSYRALVDLFWDAHDPTTLNRQGADEGTQYRSIILYRTEAEKTAAVASRDAAQARFKSKIVTQIEPLTTFYAAEAYHQDFYERNPNHGYNRAVIRPKIDKLEKKGVFGSPKSE